MHWIEIGVNLGHKHFNRDRDAVLDRALAAGVTRLVITGTDLRASREASRLITSPAPSRARRDDISAAPGRRSLARAVCG